MQLPTDSSQCIAPPHILAFWVRHWKVSAHSAGWCVVQECVCVCMCMCSMYVNEEESNQLVAVNSSTIGMQLIDMPLI